MPFQYPNLIFVLGVLFFVLSELIFRYAQLIFRYAQLIFRYAQLIFQLADAQTVFIVGQLYCPWQQWFQLYLASLLLKLFIDMFL